MLSSIFNKFLKMNSLMRLIMLLMRQLRIGIFQVRLDGILTMKIHQLTLISLNQLIVSKRKLIWGMMTHQMQLQLKLVWKITIKLLDEAGKETSDLNKRYEKYAAAQAWLTDSSLFLPAMSSSGAAPFISRVVPSQLLIANLETKVQISTSNIFSYKTSCNKGWLWTSSWEWIKEKKRIKRKSSKRIGKSCEVNNFQ